MKKLTNLLFVLLVVLMATSCNQASKDNEMTKSFEQENETKHEKQAESKGKYEIKSGIVDYKSNTLGMDQKIIITFDNFGNKETTDTYVEMMGIKSHSRTIVKDGFAYNLNMDEKTGTKVKMLGSGGSAIDYSNLSKEVEEKMNMKKLGKETILGKECEIFSFDYKEMSTKGTTSVWKGIPLKSEVTTMGMKVTMIAEKLDEKSDIPDTFFEVPKDFKIIER